MALPDFGRLVNPISTRETDYAHNCSNSAKKPPSFQSSGPRDIYAVKLFIKVFYWLGSPERSSSDAGTGGATGPPNIWQIS